MDPDTAYASPSPERGEKNDIARRDKEKKEERREKQNK
jgi:hypothetical protein